MYYWQKSSYSCFCPLEERKSVEIGVPQLRTSFVQVMAFDIRAINWFSIYFAAKRAMNEAKLKCWSGFPKFLELRQHLGCVILNEKDTVMHSYLSTHKRRWYSHRGTFRGFLTAFSWAVLSDSKQRVTEYSFNPYRGYQAAQAKSLRNRAGLLSTSSIQSSR